MQQWQENTNKSSPGASSCNYDQAGDTVDERFEKDEDESIEPEAKETEAEKGNIQ